jgi:uncharacterized membrane protein (DUF485 family)
MHPQKDKIRAMPEAHPTRRAGGALRFWLFGLYLACYVAFMILTAFRRDVMAWAPFGGANVAVLSGFALIGAAIAFAVLYLWLSRDAAAAPEASR